MENINISELKDLISESSKKSFNDGFLAGIEQTKKAVICYFEEVNKINNDIIINIEKLEYYIDYYKTQISNIVHNPL